MRDAHPLRARAEAHIGAMGRRTSADHERLAGILRMSCWPDVGDDRLEPAGIAWVRRWGRAVGHTVAHECTCRQGNCAVCN